MDGGGDGGGGGVGVLLFGGESVPVSGADRRGLLLRGVPGALPRQLDSGPRWPGVDRRGSFGAACWPGADRRGSFGGALAGGRSSGQLRRGLLAVDLGRQ